MVHPHRSQASESSRGKFKAITGQSGVGHAHAGASHLREPDSDGARKTWSGHHKTHLSDEKPSGGRAKPRFARGGKVKDAPREVNVTIQMTPAQGEASKPILPPPVAPPPAPPAPAPAAPPPPGGMGGAGPGSNPMAALGKGMGFKAGGRVAGDSNYDLAHWRNYAAKGRTEKAETRANGGKVSGGRMTAGALTGEGRLEKAEHAKGRK
jgi:hypothetical protein